MNARTAGPCQTVWHGLIVFAVGASCAYAATLSDAPPALQSVIKAARLGNIAGLAPLKELHDSKTAELVLALIDDKKISDAIKHSLGEIVSQWPADSGMDFIVKQAQRQRQPDDTQLRFYAELGHPELRKTFTDIVAAVATKPGARITDPSRFAIAVRALGKYPDQSEGAVTFIASLLAEAQPHLIRDAAADALGGFRQFFAVEALIPVANDPAIGDAVLRSLFRLTGEDFGADVAKWNEWVKAGAQKPELKMLALADWDAHVKEKAEAAAADENKPAGTSGFYGLEVKGRHTLFILDCSGSMFGDRMDTLKTQMTNILNDLRAKSSSVHIGILTFSDTFHSCFPGRGLQENNPATLDKAAKFVKNMQAQGNTAMMTTFKHVASSILPAGDVDTIYFLSDGAPSDASPEDVQSLVVKMFSQYHFRMHTIGIGEGMIFAGGNITVPSLLKQLAEATGGTYLAK